ncbi:(deoxy)nucleoside triphosphate pyrophosphohydrolase [Candidatus Sumerlaeota bacterium]|nr:(deoxy)nucleoside triphosphate pyrophosphohydrolase [Candidatus Sumerlaeota bacterium]HMZ53008.1 (deoxy)nucleoside triphosphate pyrophosphohydrolase [Candidatus Sumerlaeota bacterium]
MSTQAPTIIVTGVLLTRNDREILIAQRAGKPPLAGKWEFPGGKVEPGEDPRAALARECREEIGCEIEVGDIYESIFHRAERGNILLLFYLARIVHGEPTALEHTALAWVTPQQMRDFDLLEADRPLIERFIAKFPSHADHGGRGSHVP